MALNKPCSLIDAIAVKHFLFKELINRVTDNALEALQTSTLKDQICASIVFLADNLPLDLIMNSNCKIATEVMATTVINNFGKGKLSRVKY